MTLQLSSLFTLPSRRVLVALFAALALMATNLPLALAGDTTICYVVADSGGANGGNDLLFSVDKTTGTENTVGTGTGTNSIEASIYDPRTDLLYGADAGILGLISQSTGVFSSAGFVPFGSGTGSVGSVAFSDVDSLGIDPFTGWMYGVHRRGGSGVPDLLFRIDQSTGAHVPGAFGGNDYVAISVVSGRSDIDDIGISSYDGRMLGVANGGGSDLLVEINKATGAAFSIGSLGVTDMEGLDFSSDGRFWGVRGQSPRSLFSVDPVSGAATAIHSLSTGSDHESVACLTGPPNRINGTVYLDQNGDATENAGEPGTSGVTVTLYRDADVDGVIDASDPVLIATSTDANGNYSFLVSATGAFLVDIETADLPAGHTLSTDNLESADFGTSLGLTDNDNDFGWIIDAELGDLVWDDLNGDGVQGGGEPGLEGVTVVLLDSGGSVISTTTTAGDGSYSFDGLAAGDYSVEFRGLPGWEFSPQDQGTNDSLDSDPNPLTGRTGAVTLLWGDIDDSVDAGMYLPAGLGDFVWNDSDGDGIQDAGELGVAGVTVHLRDSGGSVIATTVTASDGSYSFRGLTPGDYTVVFVDPAGLVPTLQNQGSDDSIDSDADPATGITGAYTLVSKDRNRTIDAGFTTAASLGDFIWEDVDGDGLQDVLEPGIGGVTVNLLDSGGSTLATTTSAGDGSYSFGELGPGDYRVEFVAPSGYVFTGADQGSNDALDSDVNPVTGRTGTVNLVPGESDPSVDAGMVRSGSVGDFVWDDLDGDGIQDSGEPGIGGVTVNLLDSGGSTVATTATAADGSYLFSGVIPGLYRVEFESPPSMNPSPADQGGDDSVDSDAVSGLTPLFVLSSNEVDVSLDAGFFTPASLGDFVWQDFDGDGLQDRGEPALGGVTVNLLDSGGGVIGSTTTAADGSYLFTGLVPGDYLVEFVAPSGTVFTVSNAGSDDTIDSDAHEATGRTTPVALTSGSNDVSVDAGLFNPASIGDLIWNDLDSDGIQDSGESGISGVTVNLLDSGGTPVASTTTAADGSYLFVGLTPGGYIVELELPAAYVIAPQDQGGDDAIDSDFDTATGRSGVIALASADTVDDIDGGLIQRSALGDRVYEDFDADGIQSPGEPGIQGVTVNLLDGGGSMISTTVTGADGTYAFTGLLPGAYVVEFVAPAGMLFVPADSGSDDLIDSDADPATGRSPVTILSPGENDTSIDAGLYATAGVGDRVWSDNDGDGVQDVGEPGIGGVTVNLLDFGGSVVATTTTDSDGQYLFTGLTPDEYRVHVVALPGHIFSPENLGDDATDSDVDTSGYGPVVTLESGESDRSVDAGMYEGARLGDFVWLDGDQDGHQDPGEPGVGGVTVRLTDDSGVVVATVATNSDGYYLFSDVEPGDYVVSIDPASVSEGLTVPGALAVSVSAGDEINDIDFPLSVAAAAEGALPLTGVVGVAMAQSALGLLILGVVLLVAARRSEEESA